ncbi:MAG: hypothetical protein ACKOBA_06105, partial [Limnohabitans sp.]
RWNAIYNPGANPEHAAGATGWNTIGAVAAALLIGTGIMMSSIVFSFQRYFEYQIEQSRKISQP